ncbi:MAG: GH32 C-terminal domain-containing protein [Muribaculaceae bacterium]|nr:GH32 C-terminal domain-containing protein [Muribaculaceae bacterium]
MRGNTTFSRSNLELNGSLELGDVKGRELELCGEFEVGSTPFGFRIFKNATASGSIVYNPNTAELTCDFSRLARLINDGGVYNGVYRCSLPEFMRKGQVMKMNVFVDHSIIDIFINDSWATSIRVFPTDTDADGAEVYTVGGAVTVKSLNAWKLDASSFGGVGEAVADAPFSVNMSGDTISLDGLTTEASLMIFDMQGRVVDHCILPAGTTRYTTELKGHYVVSVSADGHRQNRTVRF